MNTDNQIAGRNNVSANKDTKLNPKFDDLQNPETIKNHVSELVERKEKATDHRDILEKLLQQIEPLDFKQEAFPKAEKLIKRIENLQGKMTNPDGSLNSKALSEEETAELKENTKRLEELKITQKHYLVLSIENILKVAKKHRWGLCRNKDFIYLYNGTYWKQIDKDTFQKFLGDAAERMGVPKFDAKYFHFRDNLFKQFFSNAILPTPETDQDKVMINLQNGTFEISDKTNLRPFNRDDFITYQLPFEYAPKATAPIFKKYLDRVLPDAESQRVLAEYLGYIFIKNGSHNLKLEKALLLYGSGRNGKSVLYDILNALLGTENFSSYTLQDLTDQSGYYRAMIANKLVNYASEINNKLEANFFKQLVSGEEVSARLPYGQPMQLRQYAKLIFNANELPRDVEQTDAFFERFLIIPFDVYIPKEERNPKLASEIIESELSGVFNWVLDGLERLLKQRKFSKCEAAEKTLSKYRLESDSVQLFIEENGYKKSADNHEPLKGFYSEYRTSCIEDGMRPVKKSNFKKRLQNAGYLVETTAGNVLSVFLSKDGEPF